jgi:hypothetical protein
LKMLHPKRFQIIYILSREQNQLSTDGYLYGRIDETVLSNVFQSFTSKDGARFLPIGTKEMMRMTDEMLTNLGFPMPQHSLLPKQKDSKS